MEGLTFISQVLIQYSCKLLLLKVCNILIPAYLILKQLKYLDVSIYFFEKVNGNILAVYHFGMMHFCPMVAPLLAMLSQIVVKILA